MRPRLVLVVVALLVSPLRGAAAEGDGAALLASGEARVEVTLTPTRDVHVGQRVTLQIEFLSTNWFTGAPRLPDVEVPGAITLKAGDLAVNASRRIEGTTYASQAWEYWVYPRRPGALRIPPLDVTFFVAGEDRKPVTVAATTAPLEVMVAMPEGAEGEDFSVATPRLEVEETWEPRPATLKVGDAFKRRIVITVQDAPGMLVEPLPAPRLDGAAVYPDPPRVEDDANRGEVVGTRIESATYVLQRPGTYTLPAIRIPWWNTEAKRMETAELEAVTFEVAANPDLRAVPTTAGPEAPPARPHAWKVWLALALLLGAAALAWTRYGPAWLDRRRADREARAQAEPALFERVLAACRDGAPEAAYPRLLEWTESLTPATTLETLTQVQPTPLLGDAVEGLRQSLYGRSAKKSAAWRGDELANALVEARTRFFEASAPPATSLPPLNPPARHA